MCNPGKLRFDTRSSPSGLAAWILLLLFPATLCGCRGLYDWVGGNFAGSPEQMDSALSPGARNLIEKAYEGIDPERLADFHVHIVADSPERTGAFVSPSVRSWRHPIRRAQFLVYLSASGVSDPKRLDEQYLERLVDLVRSTEPRGRYFIYAMDEHYRPDGTADPEHTPYYVPNAYVFALAERNPDLFVPVASVHPYRKDALEELDRWAEKGCRFVKWLPNSMGIDPSGASLEPFYRKLKERGMVLLVHTGRELAVYTGGKQHLGNPLLLRKPLDMGVTVVALHSASDGRCEDPENPAGGRVPCFDLLLRLMDEPKYEGRLFGEISALTFFNHLSRPLELILARADLHGRFVNGSDYPLPGINLLIMTRQLARLGFITGEERSFLNEIYGYNPLLFDFVLKRTLRHPESGRRFPPSVFMMPPELSPPPPPTD